MDNSDSVPSSPYIINDSESGQTPMWVWGLGIFVVIAIVLIIYYPETLGLVPAPAPAPAFGPVMKPAVVLAPVAMPCQSYKGCYKDSSNRVLGGRLGTDTLSNCYNMVKSLNPIPKYFGLQHRDGSTDPTRGECWYGDGPYDTLGAATTCSKPGDLDYVNYAVGGPYSNAVYDMSCAPI